MKQNKKITCLLLTALLTINLIGCGGSLGSEGEPAAPQSESSKQGSQEEVSKDTASQVPIKIGMVGPITGANAQAGADMKNGAEMAIQEINAAGGVEGHPLELVVEDDQSIPADSVSAMEKIIGSKVVGVIGSFNSSCTIANMEVTKREGIPQITVSAADSITFSDNPYMFRNSPYTSMFSQAMMKYISQNMPDIKTLAILGENTDYGLGIIEGIKELAAKSNIEVLNVQAYNPRDTDFYSQLTKAKELDPDGILMAGDRTEGAQIIRQGQELGLGEKQWFGFLSMSTTDFHDLAGGSENGLIFVSAFEPIESNPASVEFSDKVVLQYGSSPTMHFAIAYDAVYLFASALKGYNADLPAYRQAVRDALAVINQPSVFGPMSFDENRQATTQAFVGQWKDGQKVVLFPS